MAAATEQPSPEPYIALQKQLAEANAVVARLRRDLTEALEQQTATAEILQAISAPTGGDPSRVFEAIAANTAQLCESDFDVVLLNNGNHLRSAAHTATSPEFAEYFERGFPVSRETTTGRHNPGPHLFVGKPTGEDQPAALLTCGHGITGPGTARLAASAEPVSSHELWAALKRAS